MSTPRRTAEPQLLSLATELRVTMSRLGRRTRSSDGGLTPSQLSALTTLEEYGRLRLNELAMREGVAAPTTSRAVDELERRGLVKRRPDPGDARSAFIELTDQGRDAVGQEADQRSLLLANRLEALDAGDVDAITAALPALRRLVERAVE